MGTKHLLVVGSSRSLKEVKDRNIPIHLIVTSPPYPMIAMWDKQFSELSDDYDSSYDEMHLLLKKVWEESYGVLVDGGLMCINIGDATRNNGDGFKLYPNHARIIEHCEEIGFSSLPYILWKKSTNKPNAFLGSGFLPPNAYVTQDCEYILIFRKGGLRKFDEEGKQRRRDSTYTKEERDKWFSQVWDDLKGAKQKIKGIKRRSAAYPAELPRRLIRMFSTKDETVLDPFVGTGTTMEVAQELGRNSVGYEIEAEFVNLIEQKFISNFEVIRRHSN